MGGDSMNHLLILGDVYRQIRSSAFKSMAFLSMLLILAGCGGGGGGESVGPEPTLASFSSSVTEGDYDLTVEFTDTSTGEVDSWLWDFGDGNGSTEANPIHTYTAEGIYTVTLTVTGPSGEDTTICQDCITVTTPAPVAAFDLDPDSGTYDLTVNFTDLSSGPIDSWLWDFGDGNTSTDQNPTHLYTEEGLYSITLQVEGPGGSDTLICDSCVTVTAPPPVAGFDADPTTGIRDLAVQFTDSSSGPITGWAWDFGDGNSSDQQNPQHIYTLAGTYTVTLTVTGPGGSDSLSCTDCITVSEPAPIAAFTPSATSGEPGLTVEFADQSTGPITQWLWDFGDGNLSAEQSPSHTYTEAGLFTVTLTVTGPGGEDTQICSDCIDVQYPAPEAAFSLDPASGTYDLSVQFTDGSSGPIDSWMWDFGDGSTSTEQSPQHVYTSAGTYSITLTVEGPGGSDSLTCSDCITVLHPAPSAGFTPSTTAGDYDLTVSFTNTSQGPITDYLWDFGDGQTSTEANPVHVYTTAGTYTVTLLATGPGGSDQAECADCITVTHPAPVADFQSGNSQGDYPLTVTFEDQSSGPISIWAWDFGDGNTSNLQNPSHTYTEAGTYDVTLTIIGPGGTDSTTCPGCVTVTSPAPVAAFSTSQTSGEYDLPVTFTSLSSGPIDSYQWSFGDGSSSTEENPTHVYTSAGTYTVSLIVTGPGGSDTSTCTDCITIDHPAPVAGFTTSTTAGTWDLPVQFMSTSTGPIDSYLWDFGDGSTSSLPSPSHTYTTAGSYTVSLTVSGPGGSDTEICQGCIDVADPAPVASFNTSATSGNWDLPVQFDSTSTGPITTLSWDFGDGGTSSRPNPIHTYTAAGIYTVTLTATGPGGSDTAVCQACITVTDPAPVASFTTSTTSGTYDLPVTFTSTSTGPIDTLMWDFGDGATSSALSPTHVYTEAGTYTVTLTAEGPGGSDIAICQSCITVSHPAPIAGFTTSTTSGTYDLPVQFQSTSTGVIDELLWDFGDGSTATGSSPSHTYTAAGTYTVTLIASGPGGDDTEICSACITVDHPAPVAGFSSSTTSGTYDLLVQFTSTSTGPIDTLVWDFGDGSSGQGSSPSHTYTAAGTYTVTLTASGPGGEDIAICTDCITVSHPAPIAGFTASTTSGTYDLPVTFTNTSTGVIDSISWDFGDGTTSSESSPSHTYTEAGTYTVTLTVSGPGGDDTEICGGCITVEHPAPVASFTSSTTSGPYDLPVTFTSTSTGPITDYLWDFGDGATSTEASPTHTYTAEGSYTVSLTVTGPGGSDQSVCQGCISVEHPAPAAAFTPSATSGTYDLTIQFSNDSTGVISDYAWDFGDGTTSSEESPSHTYTTEGIYTVTLTVSGPGGSDTVTCLGCIAVDHPAPVASFTASTTSGTYDLAVQFESTSSGPITEYLWDFGDGSTSTRPAPSHTYTAEGSYTVTLTVTGPGGSDTEICSDCITVGHPAPIASFTTSTTSGTYDLPVTFTSTSTGVISGLLWDFGDGTTSTEASPTHTYTSEGIYTVTLTASGPGGSDIATCSDCITVGHPAPEASFTSSTTSGTWDLNVQFTSTSSGPITEYLWDFGDGSSSTEISPLHTYTSAGTYTVTLLVTGPGGEDTAICTDCIVVTDPAPVASFTTSTTSGTWDLPVQFTSTSTGPITSYLWDFGDGSTSSMASPSHTYTTAGDYTVSLTVTGPGGSDTEICQGCIRVEDPAPVASFDVSVNSGIYDLAVQFTNTSTGPVTSYAWNFGDGSTSTEENPTHTYTSAGLFTVTLTVTGPGGTDTAICGSCITVASPPPSAAFSASTTSGTWDLPVQFTNESTGPISGYLWSFGDGSTSSAENPLHTYTTPGTYVVTLTVNGPGGSDTMVCTDCITVLDPAPVANFSVSTDSAVIGDDLTFTDLSTNPVTSHLWDFGDGTTSTLAQPVHSYAASGTYTVSLTVTGPGGTDTHVCTDCIFIQELPPVADLAAQPVGGIYDMSIGFTDLSTGVIDSWLWQFGDGATSTEQNPTHSYASSGSYDITLTVTGPGGSDTKICLGCAEVQSPPPIANMQIDSVVGEAPFTVNFSDNSQGEINFWFWNFGDGGISVLQNPSHTFMTPGNYSITLVVSGPAGNDTVICPVCITVTEAPPYRLEGTDSSVAVGETTEVSIRLDHNEAGSEVQAWSYGLCHDNLSLNCVSAEGGLGLTTINNGNPPDFEITQIHADGYTAGVVISFTASATLPATQDLEINRITYSGLQEGSTSLQFCNTLGNPPIISVLVVDNVSIAPVMEPIQIDVTPAP